MSDKVRCPSCRGAKIVPKLGGIVGDCNKCSGKGTILECNVLKPVVTEELPAIDAIIKATSDCVPASIDYTAKPWIDPNAKPKFLEPFLIEDQPVKVNPKKVLYKRKTASK